MRKFLSLILSIIIGVTALSVVGCDKSDKRTLAVAITPIQTFVKEVVKDNFEIVAAIPNGQSPETYEPKPKEVVALNSSELYFSIGIPNEAVNVIPNLDKKITKIYLNEKVVESGLADRYFAENSRDPHIWLSVKRAAVCVEIILQEIVKIDSENAAFYTENANTYIEKLNALYSELKQEFDNADASKKKIIVYHPSFGYFADEFGIEMYALEKEGHEATAKDLAEMVDFAKQNGIKKIFYQAEHDSAQAVSFANEIGGTAYTLSPLSGDYINNLREMAELILK